MRSKMLAYVALGYLIGRYPRRYLGYLLWSAAVVAAFLAGLHFPEIELVMK